MERKSFVFYRSFFEAGRLLEREKQTELWERVIEYALEGKISEPCSREVEALFILIRPQLDANNSRYEGAVRGGKAKQTAAKNGHPEAEEAIGLEQTEAIGSIKEEAIGFEKKKPNENDNENEYENENENVSCAREREEEYDEEEIPSFPMIEDYCKKKGLTLNPKYFYEYYYASGWRDSTGKPVRNWRQLLIAWAQREARDPPERDSGSRCRSYDTNKSRHSSYITETAQKILESW